jgi:hypothetical protein
VFVAHAVFIRPDIAGYGLITVGVAARGKGSPLVVKAISPDAPSAGSLHALVPYCPAVACQTLAYGAGVTRCHRAKPGSCWAHATRAGGPCWSSFTYDKGETFTDSAAEFGNGHGHRLAPPDPGNHVGKAVNEIPEAGNGPTLAWSAYPGAEEGPPPVPELGGRPVQWAGWEMAPQVMLIELVCARCGYDGQPWTAIGLVAPTAGATVTVLQQRQLPSGRTYLKEKRVPARPALRLFAYRCPACRVDEVYDMGERGRDWRILL